MTTEHDLADTAEMAKRSPLHAQIVHVYWQLNGPYNIGILPLLLLLDEADKLTADRDRWRALAEHARPTPPTEELVWPTPMEDFPEPSPLDPGIDLSAKE